MSSFPIYCIFSVRNVKFYPLLNSSFIYKGKTFLGWRDQDIKHKASGAAFLRHALTGSVEADLRQVLFSNFPFWGEEGQGENRKARKRLRKSATDSYGTIANCHLPRKLDPRQSARVRILQILQTTSWAPARSVNSLLDTHRIGDFKANSGANSHESAFKPISRFTNRDRFPTPYLSIPRPGRWFRQFRILEQVTGWQDYSGFRDTVTAGAV